MGHRYHQEGRRRIRILPSAVPGGSRSGMTMSMWSDGTPPSFFDPETSKVRQHLLLNRINFCTDGLDFR